MLGIDKMFDLNKDGKLSPLERALQIGFFCEMERMEHEDDENDDDDDTTYEWHSRKRKR